MKMARRWFWGLSITLGFLCFSGCSSSGQFGDPPVDGEGSGDVVSDVEADVNTEPEDVDTGKDVPVESDIAPDTVQPDAEVTPDETEDPCPGFTECNGICVDTQTDSGHCGGCNQVCPSGAKCKEGECSCTAMTSPGICGNQCKDLDNDPAHCGECDSPCPAGADCLEGSCVCPEGLSVCGTTCVDLSSDPVHCGECGGACPVGTSCVGGFCEMPAPRLVSPLSTMHVTSTQPRFSWELDEIHDGALLEICADPACAEVLTSVEVAGSEWTLEESLSPGPAFWRVRGMFEGVIGAESSHVWTVYIPFASSAMETAWGSVPDFNGDGLGEVVVGACGLGGQGCSQSVYVFEGELGGVDPATPRIVTGGGAGSVFGYAVRSAGDVNGDGLADLVVGSWVTATIWIYLGSADGLMETPVVEIHESGGIFPLFGHAVASAGDVNGDGYADVLAGNPLDSALYVYYGGPEGPSQANGVTLFGSQENGIGMGISADGACDLNGDGFSDVFGGNGTGQVLVYYGAPEGPTPENTTLLARDDLEGNSLCTAKSDCPFGIAVSCLGDVNGDGYADMGIGAYDDDGSFVYLGGPGGVETTPTYRLLGDNQPGISMAPAGDINGDGLDDVIVGGQAVAAVYYFADAENEVAPAITLDGPTGSFGNAVAGARDVNGDNTPDVMVGDPALGVVRIFSWGNDGLLVYSEELRGQGTAGCASEACQDLICPSDSYCCDVAWDPQCANFANAVCDVCPVSNCCAKKTSKGCSDASCADVVCAVANYESCCLSEWEAKCYLKAVELCPICPQDNCCTTNEATGFGYAL